MECAPAFNYGRDQHTLELIEDDSSAQFNDEQEIDDVENQSGHSKEKKTRRDKMMFKSKTLNIDLRVVTEKREELGCGGIPDVELKELDLMESCGHLGISGCSDFEIEEGGMVTFIVSSIILDVKQLEPDFHASHTYD